MTPSPSDRSPPSSGPADPSRVTGAGEGEAGAILTVDLAAVRRNFRALRDLAAPAACAAVVKADAYGLGAKAIAQTLAAEGCRIFFVAHWAEARTLRPRLPPHAVVFVLNGVMPGAERRAAAEAAEETGAAIVPVLNSLEHARLWGAEARRLGGALPAALHVDTGLSRLGFSESGTAALLAAPDLLPWLDLRLLISHLACADESGDAANAGQHAAFLRAREAFPGLPASLCNSSGIFLGSPFRFDVVRAGAALYGINPLPGRPNPMRQAVRLEARVIQCRDLRPGDAVGYGRDFVADRPLRAATVGLGYGDGWPRLARLAAFADAVRLPILGRVSMDTVVLDVSALAPGRLEAGGLVEFLGDRQTPDDVAAAAGTIGYEILAGLGRRPFRRYRDDAERGDGRNR